MGNAIVGGGLPGGKPLIALSRRPAQTTFYVALPPPGKHHNVRRYPIAVVGPGYHGLLTDTSTRLAGLISIADVAPSARALQRGERPSIRFESVRRPARPARELRPPAPARRTTRAMPATLVLVGLLIVLSLAALLTRAPLLCRAAFLVAFGLHRLGGRAQRAGVSPRAAVLGVAMLGGGGALLGGALLPPRLPLALALTALFVFLFAVMWARPEWNALAVIGPHPDGGGRFYGVTNEVETLLLPPALVLGALAGVRAAARGRAGARRPGSPTSRIGADGGGLVVYLAGFLVLWLRLRHVPALRAAAATAVAAGAALLLVGIDAATGGSSHVTKAVGGGPGSVLGDLGHRLHLSAASDRLDLEQRAAVRARDRRAGRARAPAAALRAARRLPRGARRLVPRQRHAHRRGRLRRLRRARPLAADEKRREPADGFSRLAPMRRLAPFLAARLRARRLRRHGDGEPDGGDRRGHGGCDDAGRGRKREGRRHALHRPGLRRLPHLQAGRHERATSGPTWTSSPSTRRPPTRGRSRTSRTSRSPTRAPTSRRATRTRCPTSARRCRTSRSPTSSRT